MTLRWLLLAGVGLMVGCQPIKNQLFQSHDFVIDPAKLVCYHAQPTDTLGYVAYPYDGGHLMLIVTSTRLPDVGESRYTRNVRCQL